MQHHPDLQLLVAHDRMQRYQDEAAEARRAHDSRIVRARRAVAQRRTGRAFDLLPGAGRVFAGRLRRPAFLRPARG